MDTLTLPHSLDAERSVLGAVFISPEVFPIAAEVLTRDDFFRQAHALIWDCITGLIAKNGTVDFVTAHEALTRNGLIEEIGGPAYLASLTDGMPRSVNIKYYAEIVKEKSINRQLIFALDRFSKSAYQESAPAAELMAGIEDFARQSSARLATSALDVIDETKLGTIAQAPMLIPGVLSTDINFLVGAPGAGKTTTAFSVGVSVAADIPWCGHEVVNPGKVLVIAGEGAGAADARLKAAKISAGIEPDKPIGIQLIRTAVQLFDRGPAYAALRRYIADAGIRLVVIDHFSLVIAGADENSAAETTAAINAARGLGCAVLFIHHMGKDSKSERGSSAIRANADVMLSLIETDDLITLKVEKIRDGVAIAPLPLKLVEYPAVGACSVRPASEVHQTGDLSPAQFAALEALYSTFGESGSASAKEWMALIPTVVERTAYHAFGRLKQLGFVDESKGRYTARRPPPPRPEKRLLQGAKRFAMPLQTPLQSAPQSLRNAKQAEFEVLQGSAMPLQSQLQGGAGGSLEPSGTLQKTGGNRRASL